MGASTVFDSCPVMISEDFSVFTGIFSNQAGQEEEATPITDILLSQACLIEARARGKRVAARMDGTATRHAVARG